MAGVRSAIEFKVNHVWARRFAQGGEVPASTRSAGALNERQGERLATGYMTHGTFTLKEAKHIMSTVETELADAEHEIDSRLVLALAQQSKLSAYDCEYVVLARVLGAALITADKAVLRAAPDVATNMREYLQAGTKSNGVKKKRAPLVPVYAVKGKGKSGLVTGLNPLSNKATLEAVDSGASA